MTAALFDTPVPGTYVTPGFVEPEIVEEPLEPWQQGVLATAAVFDEVRFYSMGEFTLMRTSHAAASGGQVLTLLLTHPERVATWDELKVARYRVLPPDRCYALMLPPPELFVNDPQLVARLPDLTGRGRRARHNLVLTEAALASAETAAWVLDGGSRDIPVGRLDGRLWRCPDCRHWLSGSPCPGCGFSADWLAAARGD